MQKVLMYTETKEFNPDYNIAGISVITGTVTLTLLSEEGGIVIASLGTLSAGEGKNVTLGRATLRVVPGSSSSYAVF